MQEAGISDMQALVLSADPESDLRAGYGMVPVLHGVSFALEAGEALGIVGRNGMGKTTLCKTIMGLVRASGGSVRIRVRKQPT